MEETVVTRQGLARLRKELERLTTVERRAVAKRLKHAAANTEYRCNDADYVFARAQQALLEGRIALLDEKLRAARLVEPKPGNGQVDVGERVNVRDLVSGERLELELVGTLESDPDAGRISVVSPLGKAIVGLRRGQMVDVETPLGRRRFKVLEVEVEPPPRAA
jgi:transcription elongation factor GreA